MRVAAPQCSRVAHQDLGSRTAIERCELAAPIAIAAVLLAEAICESPAPGSAAVRRCTRHIWHRSSSASNLPGTTLLGSHSLHAVDAPLSKQKMATSAELYASAQILGTECAAANMAFLKCKAEAQHPRHCLEAGTAVTFCAVRKSTNGLGYPMNYCVDLRDLMNLHAIELPQLRGHRHVDGIESPRHRADAVTGTTPGR